MNGGEVALVMFLLLLLTCHARADPPTAHVLARTPQTVAVDNVCAWPNLTVLPDGSIAANIYNMPNHSCATGDVECWASEDGELTWNKRGTPARHTGHTCRHNVGAGLAHNGDLIVISSGWELKMHGPRPPEGEVWRGGLVRVLEPWVCRSGDGGRTWEVARKAMPTAEFRGEPPLSPPIPFGDIFSCSDGSLRVAAYELIAEEPEKQWRAFVYRSDDDGRNWGRPMCIDEDASLNEVALLPLGDGRWLAAARGPGWPLYISEDDCATWARRGRVPGPSSPPAHLMSLSSGRIIVSASTRALPGTGTSVYTYVCYSDDEGETWSQPYIVAEYLGDGGYPSTVELPDGRALTAYYAEHSVDHPRYHMGVVIWDPAATFAR